MKGLVNCGTEASGKICTLSDLIITANNLSKFIITIVWPTLLAVAVVYTAIKLLLNLNKPDALAGAKKNVKYILEGSLFMVASWGLLRFALKLMGWKGDISKPLGYIFGIDTAYAAPLVNPSGTTEAQAVITTVIGYSYILVGIALAVALVYVGFRFLNDSDNPVKLKETKKILLIVVVVGVLVFSIKGITTALFTTVNKIFGDGAGSQVDTSNKATTDKPNTPTNPDSSTKTDDSTKGIMPNTDLPPVQTE